MRIKTALNALEKKYIQQPYTSKFLISLLINIERKKKSMIKIYKSQQLLLFIEEKIFTEKIYQMIIINHSSTQNFIHKIIKKLK